MKNLLAFCCLVFSVPAFAQLTTISPGNQAPKPAFSVSVVGGLNVNQMLYRPNPNPSGMSSWNDPYKPETAYFLGISANQPLNQHFAAKLDVQYVVKGYAFELNDPFLITPDHYQVSYLEFSPQITLKLYREFHLLLGGYGEVRLDERIKFPNQGWMDINPIISPLANRADWGLLGGVGVQFDKVSLFAKYLYGLTSVWDTEYYKDSGEMSKTGQYHQSLQIGLGFKLL